MTIARTLLITQRAAFLAVAAVLLLSACSTGSTATSSPTSSPASTAPTAPTATPDSSEAASTAPTPSGTSQSYTVAVATTTLGNLLTGEGGKTLYTLKTDGPNKTTCTGGCASAWPAFTLAASESTIAGSGVSGTLGTFVRPDGTTQVTYNSVPLYYFSGDATAGDTNGQGAGGVWFVAQLEKPTPSSPPTPKITPAPRPTATQHPTATPTPEATPSPTLQPTAMPSSSPYAYPSY